MVSTILIHGVIKNKFWRVVGWWMGRGSWREVIVMDMSSGKSIGFTQTEQKRRRAFPNQGNFERQDQKKNMVEQMQALPEWQKRQHWLTQLGDQSRTNLRLTLCGC